MTDQNIRTELIAILGSDNVLTEEPMKKHTTFRIGGNADYFVTPVNAEQIQSVVAYLKKEKIPFYVVGNGSNLLVSDEGFRGVVIQLYDKLRAFEILSEKESETYGLEGKVCVRAQAGIMLGRLGNELAARSLAGFEFATGIPGTLGGAVRMNAGAYGGEMKDVLVNATVIDTEGNLVTMNREELKLGYRTSIIDRNQYIVVEAVLALEKGNQDEINDKIKDLAGRRRDKQPLEYPSAGSTFKRPEGYFAGKLISDAGLKGFSVGGAQVSEKHAGFVINTGDATAKDVIDLTDAVRDKVQKEYGVTLELEVRKLGF